MIENLKSLGIIGILLNSLSSLILLLTTHYSQLSTLRFFGLLFAIISAKQLKL